MKLTNFGGPGPRSNVSRVFSALEPQSRAQIAKPTYQGTTPTSPPSPATNQQNTGSSQTGTSQEASTAGGGTAATDPSVAAAAAGQYDLSADPVLQQVQAAVTLGDQQANTQALKARAQLLLQYGDPTLAATILGANDPMVKAAGANPESTLSLLKRGYSQGLANFDNTLDPSLIFSGARIHGEGLLGQDYQDRLAQAAASVQAGLSGINDNLSSALMSDRDRLNAALADAYNRELQNALANPPADSSTSTSSSGSGSGGGKGKPKPKPKGKRHRLAHAAGGGRPARGA